MSRRLKAPSPAMVVALIALFVSIGGVGYAASKIDTDDLASGAVTKRKLHNKAVNTRKISNQAVKTGKIADAAITTDKLGFQSVTEDKLASDSVTTGKLGDQSVANGKLAAAAVHASELGPIETIDKITSIPASGTRDLFVTCPPGTTLINGGGTTSSFGVHMVGSMAVQQDNLWTGSWQNTTNAEQNVRVVANCLSK